MSKDKNFQCRIARSLDFRQYGISMELKRNVGKWLPT